MWFDKGQFTHQYHLCLFKDMHVLKKLSAVTLATALVKKETVHHIYGFYCIYLSMYAKQHVTPPAGLLLESTPAHRTLDDIVTRKRFPPYWQLIPIHWAIGLRKYMKTDSDFLNTFRGTAKFNGLKIPSMRLLASWQDQMWVAISRDWGCLELGVSQVLHCTQLGMKYNFVVLFKMN